jgi:hypothetical protein
VAKHEILTSEAHRNLRVRTDRGNDLGDAVMTCLTFPAEFRQVQGAYPILFRMTPERDTFTPVALLGFENAENLFLVEGRWDARYIPLAIDIQPFLIGSPDGEGQRQVHIDLDSPRIADREGVRLFDDAGRPSPYLDSIAEKLGALDEGYRATGEFLSALRRYELLEPMMLEVTLDDGSTNRLVGFHVIAEEKLQALDPDSIAGLHRDGHLMPIFMAVASLANLSELIARKSRRAQHE